MSPRCRKTGSLRGDSTLGGLVCASAVAVAVGGPVLGQDGPCYYEVTMWEGDPCALFGGEYTGAIGKSVAGNGLWTGDVGQCDLDGGFWPFLYDGQQFETLIPPFAGVWNAECHGGNSGGAIVGLMDISGVGQRGFVRNGNSNWTDIGTIPGGNFSGLLAINGAGAAVGTSGNFITGPSPVAIIWDDGELINLGAILGSNKNDARDINNAGAITGWSGTSQGTDARAFIYEDDGTLTTLPPVLDGYTSEGEAINEYGDVAGIGRISQPDGTGYFRRGFLWSDSQMTDLGVIAGLDETFVHDMNDQQEIVGYCAPESGGGNRAFVWREGEITALDDLVDPALNLNILVAYSIDNEGVIAAWGGIGNGVALALKLTPPNPADINGDCVVDVIDLLTLLGDWGGGPSPSDLNGDNIVNVLDLLFLLANWG